MAARSASPRTETARTAAAYLLEFPWWRKRSSLSIPACSKGSLDPLYILCHGLLKPGGVLRGDSDNEQFEAARAAGAEGCHRGAGGSVRQPADHFAGGSRPACPYHHVAGAAAPRRGGDGGGNPPHPGRGAELRQTRSSRDPFWHP